MPKWLRWLISSRLMHCLGLQRYSPKHLDKTTCENSKVRYHETSLDDAITVRDGEKYKELEENSTNENDTSQPGSNNVITQKAERIPSSGYETDDNQTSKEMWKCLATFVDRFIVLIEICVYTFAAFGAIHYTKKLK